MVLTLEEFLVAHPAPSAELAASGEIVAARTVLAVVAARLGWSADLCRKIAYLPDTLLQRAPGASIAAVRAYYGSDVLVVPESVEFR